MDEIIKMNYTSSDDSTWNISIEGPAIRAISQSLINDGMPEESVIQTINNAAEVLAYCPDPYPNEYIECKKTGIVIGKVQSGKTSNFISLAALAFDNGYNVIVVLGGTKKILVNQNKERIEKYFSELVYRKDIVILDTNSNKSLLNSEQIELFIEAGKKVIIVALKNPTQIGKVWEEVFSDSYLMDAPVLIIDDEGDEASLNGLVKKKKKTATYQAIEQLKNNLKRHCFVSVTATPQANILIDAIDVLSPDFGVLVNPGEGYCGLDVFHSDDKYIRSINDEDILHGKGLPESFYRALAMFFVACAIHRVRTGDKNACLSMLVHESQLTEIHKSEYEKIKTVISNWIKTTANKNDIAYKGDLRKILYKSYLDYYESDIKNLPKFEELEDEIIYAIKSCGVHMVNGLSASNGDDQFFNYNIYVGGALLGRGLTIKKLAITYITRTPRGKATVDTSEQRARWFGYKKDILDLCRIFMVPKLEKEFMDIRDHEEDLWETVNFAQAQGTHFKDIVRIFTLSDRLRMTRTSVATADTFKFSHWNKQRIFLTEPEQLSNNNALLDKFKNEHSKDLRVESVGSGADYSIILSTYEIVERDLLKGFVFPSEEPKLNHQMLHCLRLALNKHSITPQAEVIWMRDGIYSDHTIKVGNKIPNYSVGRRPKDPDQPQKYAGDDNHFCKEGIIQLQVHMIRDKITGVVSPTLALYIPDDIVSCIADLVIRS